VIAVTVGPGLVTSLSVGVETAKVLSYTWKVPVIAVNHIEAHLYANFIEREKIEFPALVLTVSGGHTILVLMRGHGLYKIIGETRDDAAGEAFDKAASLFGLGYPGGPAISVEAAKFISIQNTRPHPSPLLSQEREKGIKLPRPMLESKNFEFSFSGLKTALLYQLKKDPDWQKRIPEYAYEFQLAAVETLVGKTIRAAKKLPVKTIMLSGGVAANTVLREQLKAETAKLGLNFLMPEMKYTTDNAAMIAATGYFKAQRKEYTDWRKLAVRVNLELA
jgi:N6-L-threonylcarbamoyladenine synthase